MKKITCNLQNASTEISGVPFVAQADGSVCAETDDDAVVALFSGIPGYAVEDLAPNADDPDAKAGQATGRGRGKARTPADADQDKGTE